MQRSHTRTVKSTLLLVIALVMTACGGTDDPSSTDVVTDEATSPEATGDDAAATEGEALEFVVGEITGITGPFVEGTRSHRAGVEMAIEHANSAGGVNISVVQGDSGETPQETLTGFESIRDDEPIAIAGAPASSQTSALGAAVADLPAIHFAPNADPVQEFGELAFNTVPNFIDYQLPAANEQFWAAFGDQVETAFIIDQTDYPSGVASNELRRAFFEEQGVEIVGHESVLGTDTDFSALANTIVNANPDLIIEDLTTVNITLLGQLQDAGFDGLVYGGGTSASTGTAELAGEVYEGIITFQGWNPRQEMTGGKAEAFTGEYEERYGSPPDQYAAGLYDAMTLLAEAVRQTGSTDPEVVGEALATIALDEGVTASPLQFDDNRTLPMNPVLVQIRDGVHVPVTSGG